MWVSIWVGLVWSRATDDYQPGCLGSCFLRAECGPQGPLSDWTEGLSGWSSAPCRSTAAPPCGPWRKCSRRNNQIMWIQRIQKGPQGILGSFQTIRCWLSLRPRRGQNSRIFPIIGRQNNLHFHSLCKLLQWWYTNKRSKIWTAQRSLSISLNQTCFISPLSGLHQNPQTPAKEKMPLTVDDGRGK